MDSHTDGDGYTIREADYQCLEDLHAALTGDDPGALDRSGEWSTGLPTWSILGSSTQTEETAMRITGADAIEYARTHGLQLNKYTDPIEEARDNLTIEEAEDVAREDQALIWIEEAAPQSLEDLDAAQLRARRTTYWPVHSLTMP